MTTASGHVGAGGVLFGELKHLRQIISTITPNWYASIMGTGIVAVAAATLPQQFPGFRTVRSCYLFSRS